MAVSHFLYAPICVDRNLIHSVVYSDINGMMLQFISMQWNDIAVYIDANGMILRFMPVQTE